MSENHARQTKLNPYLWRPFPSEEIVILIMQHALCESPQPAESETTHGADRCFDSDSHLDGAACKTTSESESCMLPRSHCGYFLTPAGGWSSSGSGFRHCTTLPRDRPLPPSCASSVMSRNRHSTKFLSHAVRFQEALYKLVFQWHIWADPATFLQHGFYLPRGETSYIYRCIFFFEANTSRAQLASSLILAIVVMPCCAQIPTTDCFSSGLSGDCSSFVHDFCTSFGSINVSFKLSNSTALCSHSCCRSFHKTAFLVASV